jgi:hypothetical protein
MKETVGSWWDDPESKSEVLEDNSNRVGKMALRPYGTSFYPVSNIGPTLDRRRRPSTSPVRSKKKKKTDAVYEPSNNGILFRLSETIRQKSALILSG